MLPGNDMDAGDEQPELPEFGGPEEDAGPGLPRFAREGGRGAGVTMAQLATQLAGRSSNFDESPSSGADYRQQFKDVMGPAFEQIQSDMMIGLQEAMYDVQSGMERRHFV